MAKYRSSSQSFNNEQVIVPLSEQCKLHPLETIKYFCKDKNCLKPLCPECIIDHSKHDFMAASELASLEIKQMVKQTERKCKKSMKQSKIIKQLSEQKLSELNKLRKEEFEKMHCYFHELHKILDEREQQLNQQYNDLIKQIESKLMKDLQALKLTYSDNIKILKSIKQLQEQYQISNEIGIIGSADQVYNLFQIIQSRERADQNKQQYFVNSDEGQRDLITPQFQIHLNQEIQKVETIGKLIIVNEDCNDEELLIQDETFTQVKQGTNLTLKMESINKQMTSNAVSYSQQNQIKKVQCTDQSTQTIKIPKVLDILVKKQKSQKQQSKVSKEDAYNNLDSNIVSPQNIHWFKWDSTEVYRYNIQLKDWSLRNEIKTNQKFLFFSSIVHLPNNQGCFILGGSDNDDNYSKRVQYFCKYNVFIEKPHMINKRAFFPSLFSKLDNSIYVIGGSDQSSNDLNLCEKFSLAENVWRSISPMNLQRNGTGAIVFDQFRLLFVFGGNNHKQGTLNKIEKYEVDFDKWTILDIQLKQALHDLQVFNLGRERVLILGGHTNTNPNKDIQILDLSFDCFKSRNGTLQLKEGGKSYLCPSFDQQDGKLRIIFGYCDDKPKIEEIDISQMISQDQNHEHQSLQKESSEYPMSQSDKQEEDEEVKE